MNIEEHYRPPASTVTEGQPLMQPKSVKRATWALLVSMALGALNFFLRPELFSGLKIAFFLFVAAVTYAILFFLFFMIWKGKNRARIVYVALTALGIFPSVATVYARILSAPFVGFSSTLQLILQVISLILLYTKESNAFFRGEVNENE